MILTMLHRKKNSENEKEMKCSLVTFGFGACRAGSKQRKRLTGLYTSLTCANFYSEYNLQSGKK